MISLAPAKPADVAAIASLLAELDVYYGSAREDPTPERVRLIHDAMFRTTPAGDVLLAWDGDVLVGLASYSFLWPAAGVSRSIFLKELYVIEAYRKQGVGRLLMAELSRITVDSGCSRLEWAADTDNPTAQQFYAQLGVPGDTTKTFHRLAGDALVQMASSPIGGRGQSGPSE